MKVIDDRIEHIPEKFVMIANYSDPGLHDYEAAVLLTTTPQHWLQSISMSFTVHQTTNLTCEQHFQ
jgi:hypothetical protein